MVVVLSRVIVGRKSKVRVGKRIEVGKVFEPDSLFNAHVEDSRVKNIVPVIYISPQPPPHSKHANPPLHFPSNHPPSNELSSRRKPSMRFETTFLLTPPPPLQLTGNSVEPFYPMLGKASLFNGGETPSP
jgi:hypothetical protein